MVLESGSGVLAFVEVPSFDSFVLVTTGFLPHLCLFKSFGVTILAFSINSSAPPINFTSHLFAISIAFPTMDSSAAFSAVSNPILLPVFGPAAACPILSALGFELFLVTPAPITSAPINASATVLPITVKLEGTIPRLVPNGDCATFTASIL